MSVMEKDLVFLSYASDDLKKVWKVYEGLKKREVNIWFDKKNLGAGRWKPQIFKAISRSKYFIICLSNAAIKKTSSEKPGFQDVELQTAWEFAREHDERRFSIIPVRLEDCGRGDMRISGWQQYDLFKDWEGVLDTLAVNLGGNSLSNASAVDERTEEEKIFESIIGKGRMFYYSGDLEKSLSMFEAAINIKPDDPDVWYNIGIVLDDLDRHEQAKAAYKESLGIEKDDYRFWFAHDTGALHEADPNDIDIDFD